MFASVLAQESEREIRITKKYLNIPVASSRERQKMVFAAGGENVREFVIRLSDRDPDYWVFSDVSAFMGESLTIRYPDKVGGLKEIY